MIGMKIGLTSGGLTFNGVSRTVFELARELSKKNECHIFTLKGYVNEEVRKMIESDKLFIHEIPYGKIKIIRRYMLFKHADVFKQYGLDVVISNEIMLGNISLLSKIPMIKVYYGYGLFLDRILSSPFKWLVTVLEDTPQIYKAVCNMAISRFAENELKILYGNKPKSMTNYLGADFDIYKERGEKKDVGHRYILYVGSINPSKKIHLLIKSFYMTGAKDVHFYIVGRVQDFAYYEELKSMSNNRVHFVGTVPFSDLPKWYRGAEIVVNGTHYDYFNLPLIEAQACGVPVVAFNKAAIPEVVSNNRTGFLANNVDEFAVYLNRLLLNKDLKHKFGKNAVKWAKNFTWKRTMENYEKVLSRI